MTSASQASGYGWLGSSTQLPGSWMQEASCFTFVRGLSVDEVVNRGRVGRSDRQGAGPNTVSDHQTTIDDGSVAIVDAGGGWVVAYQANGFPEQFANFVAESPDPEQVVVVFWNVNANIEFSLWERGQQVVTFTDSPHRRRGADPDRLSAEVNSVFGREQEDRRYERGVDLYIELMALSDLVTGRHLDSDFLDNDDLVIGVVEEFDEEPSTDTAEEYFETLSARERRKIAAEVARLACSAAGIAELEPARSALAAIAKKQPPPEAMSDPTELRRLFLHAMASEDEDPWALDGEALYEGTPKSRVKAALGVLDQVNHSEDGRIRPGTDLDLWDFLSLLDTAEAAVEPNTPSLLQQLRERP